MARIKKIRAREVLDSRGNPTVEVDVDTGNVITRAIVPSGASTGIHEALELRDKQRRFLGKGVLKAVNNVNKIIAKKIVGKDCTKQKEIDELMIKLDGTENKSRLGANAILGVSLAVCRAGAFARNETLYSYISDIAKTRKLMPIPSFNVINGGVHAGNKLDIQEFMIMPTGAKNFHEAMQIGSETYHILKSVIKAKYGKNAVNVGDEGGFAPPLKKTEDALKLIMEALKDIGHEKKVKIAIDSAASEFYKNKRYNVDGKKMNSEELSSYYENLIKKYPIVSLEDPFAEDDFTGFSFMTKKIGRKIQIVGDDLLVTNVERIKKAIKEKACNALLLKVNQIGTVSEAINAAKLAMKNRWNVMVSHRSGETEDSFIADLVVGLGTGQIKSGAPCRSERNAKYNQLLRIEEELGKVAYAGKNF